MKMKLQKMIPAAVLLASVAGASADATTDPLLAASTQIATWTPIVGTLAVAAFGIAVIWKGLGLGKKGVAKA
jgi:hypothetical protein